MGKFLLIMPHIHRTYINVVIANPRNEMTTFASFCAVKDMNYG